MSWINGCIILKEDEPFAEREIRSAVRDHANLREFPHMGERLFPIENLMSEIFDSYDEAENYIEDHIGDWYRKRNVVVHYRDLQSSKKLSDLKTRREKELEKMQAYENAYGISSFSAKFVGCAECGSKLSKEHLRGNRCPVCGTDLRSKTTLDTLKRYQTKIRELAKAAREEEETCRKKSPLRQLVRYCEYIG